MSAVAVNPESPAPLPPLAVASPERMVETMRDFLALVTDEDRGRVARAVEREIIEVVNREQERIGHDLYDALGQELTGIGLMLKALAGSLDQKAPEAVADLERVLGLVTDAVRSTRSLAYGRIASTCACWTTGSACPSLRTRQAAWDSRSWRTGHG